MSRSGVRFPAPPPGPTPPTAPRLPAGGRFPRIRRKRTPTEGWRGMAAAKTAATKAAGTTKNAASKPATVIVSYKVKDEDSENFLNAWERANDFLKKQPGH